MSQAQWIQSLSQPTVFTDQAYIDGKWLGGAGSGSGASGSSSVGSCSKGKFDVLNPENGEVLASVPDLGVEETKVAIAAAHAALPQWRNLAAKERSKILRRWFELIVKHQDALAVILTREQGKSLTESKGEITYGASFIEWFAEEAKRVYGDVIPAPSANQRIVVMQQPIGVVAAITPWNFPTAMITRKIAPALAAGCTVVVKPADETPLSALALAKLAEEAGFPKGVINVITTKQTEAVGRELTENPLVRKVSFTGSTAVGKILMKQSSSTLKKLSLELGGNAPFIVFDDANLDQAVEGAVSSKFRNSGQTCVCTNRFFVHEKVYDAFAEKLVTAVSKLKMGSGLEAGVQQGPLINKKAVEKVEAHLKDALSKGAKIACGGKPSSLGELFFEPTVLTNATQAMLFANEETFGPVAGLIKFKSDDEVVRMANDTAVGLAAYFYSQNVARVWKIAGALEVGMVGINEGIISNEVAPFGGIKESGQGREGSKYGIHDYLETKYLMFGHID